MTFNRRQLCKGVIAATASSIFSGCATLPLAKTSDTAQNNSQNSIHDWQRADEIRKNTIVPTFPAKRFVLTDYQPENQSNDYTQAFADAISACHQQGGGKVIVPPGVYPTGPVHLLSNVNLVIEKGADVQFIPEPERYLPAVFTRWEGMELMGYSPLIYAYKQTNIAITGEGTLSGGADNQTWWPWKGPHKEKHWDLIPGEDQKPARQKLMQDVEDGVPVAQRQYADGAFLRPPFIQPYDCQNVLVQGITIKDSPFWLLNPVLCKNVTVNKVKFLSHGPNNDGCNPESCDHVVIENCIFDTGDDCIAIKSGRNNDGRRLNTPCQNLVIANCNMKEGHGGVVVGSEISGGVNHLYVENCVMDSPHLERAIRIKTNSVRGGKLEHFRYRNITVGRAKTAIVINFYYEEGDAGKFDPTVRDVVIEDLVCRDILVRPFNIQGFERKPIYDLTLKNCHFLNESPKSSIVRNINQFELHNVSIAGKTIDAAQLISNS